MKTKTSIKVPWAPFLMMRFWLLILCAVAGIASSSPAAAYWQFIQKQRYFHGSNELYDTPEEFCANFAASLSTAQGRIWVVDHIDKYQQSGGSDTAICYLRDSTGFTFGATLYGYCPNPPSPPGSPVYGFPGGCYISTATCPAGYSLLSTGECYPWTDDNEAGNPGSCSPSAGNPIYPLTGSKRQREVLGQWAGNMFSVDYDTRSKVPGSVFSVTNSPSFGPLWQSSLHKRLVLQSNSTGVVQAIQASRGGAGWISFSRNAAGAFVPHSGIADRLSAVSGGWRYVDAASQAIETYDASGVLTAISSAGGAGQTYAYSTSATPSDVAPAAELLLAVQDQYGRSVQFTYEAGPTAAHVRRFVDPNGGVATAS